MRVYYLLFLFELVLYAIVVWIGIGTKKDLEEHQRKEARKKKFLIISFIPIVLLTAFRSKDVGYDTSVYLGHFERVREGMETELDRSQFEIGYRYFVRLILHFTRSRVAFLSTVSIITNVPIALMIAKYSKDYFLSVILYITIGSFTFQLTGIRQSIALSILAIAVHFALNRKLIWFLICIFIASLFHRSAYLFAPVYLLGNEVINRRTFFLLAVSAVFIAFSDVILTKVGIKLQYDEYFSGDVVKGFGGWTNVIIMVLTIALYLMNKYWNPEAFSKSDQFFFTMLIFALALYIIRYQNRAAERVSLYYRMALIILLPNSIDGTKNFSIRNVIAMACTVFAIMLFIYWTINGPYSYTPFWKYMIL